MALGSFGHTAIDIVSGVSDFFSAGSLGILIDVFHGILYLKEMQESDDEQEKRILYYQSLITFGSALLPAVAQAAAPIVKQMIKSKNVSPKVVKYADKLAKNAKPFVDYLLRVKKTDVDRLTKTIIKVKKINDVKVAEGYAYLCLISDKLGLNYQHGFKASESITEKAYEILISMPTEYGKNNVEEDVKKVGGNYAVYPKSGGKRLGTHKTKKQANKQIQAIEINKNKK